MEGITETMPTLAEPITWLSWLWPLEGWAVRASTQTSSALEGQGRISVACERDLAVKIRQHLASTAGIRLTAIENLAGDGAGAGKGRLSQNWAEVELSGELLCGAIGATENVPRTLEALSLLREGKSGACQADLPRVFEASGSKTPGPKGSGFREESSADCCEGLLHPAAGAAGGGVKRSESVAVEVGEDLERPSKAASVELTEEEAEEVLERLAEALKTEREGLDSRYGRGVASAQLSGTEVPCKPANGKQGGGASWGRPRWEERGCGRGSGPEGRATGSRPEAKLSRTGSSGEKNASSSYAVEGGSCVVVGRPTAGSREGEEWQRDGTGGSWCAEEGMEDEDGVWMGDAGILREPSVAEREEDPAEREGRENGEERAIDEQSEEEGKDGVHGEEGKQGERKGRVQIEEGGTGGKGAHLVEEGVLEKRGWRGRAMAEGKEGQERKVVQDKGWGGEERVSRGGNQAGKASQDKTETALTGALGGQLPNAEEGGRGLEAESPGAEEEGEWGHRHGGVGSEEGGEQGQRLAVEGRESGENGGEEGRARARARDWGHLAGRGRLLMENFLREKEMATGAWEERERVMQRRRVRSAAAALIQVRWRMAQERARWRRERRARAEEEGGRGRGGDREERETVEGTGEEEHRKESGASGETETQNGGGFWVHRNGWVQNKWELAMRQRRDSARRRAREEELQKAKVKTYAGQGVRDKWKSIEERDKERRTAILKEKEKAHQRVAEMCRAGIMSPRESYKRQGAGLGQSGNAEQQSQGFRAEEGTAFPSSAMEGSSPSPFPGPSPAPAPAPSRLSEGKEPSSPSRSVSQSEPGGSALDGEEVAHSSKPTPVEGTVRESESEDPEGPSGRKEVHGGKSGAKASTGTPAEMTTRGKELIGSGEDSISKSFRTPPKAAPSSDKFGAASFDSPQSVLDRLPFASP